MRQRRQLMWPLIGLSFAVLCGIAYMAAAHAPPRFIIMNGSALIGAILVALAPPLPRKWFPIAAVLCVVGMIATLFLSPTTFGIRRWVQLGPLTVHVGMLLLPALAVIVPAIAARTAAIALIAVAFITVGQLDAATSMAVLALSTFLIIKQRNRWTIFAFVIALLVAFTAMVRLDMLPPAPFVERVIEDAWAWNKAAGLVIFIAALAAIFSPFAIASGGAQRVSAAALVTCGGVFFAASILGRTAILSGHYPTPFVGFGGSIIVGWGIALWLLGSLGDRSRV